MAGEAGRGFAVVADEVQRLAERSATATKQIAGLVKTIQSDTNEAVSSMEQTTAEVVKGAELAHSAGIALEEIESVSTNLAELIQDISEAAKHQATTSAHISHTMNVIQEITSQTLSGTNDTATSIGELAEMAVEMKHSVSGFILPDSTKNELLRDSEETSLEHASSEHQEELDDDQLGAMFAVAAEADVDPQETLSEDPDVSNGREPLNLNFAASAELHQDFNEDLEVDAEDPEELLHLEEFEAEIEAMLTDEGDRKA
jgi:twitching motility protein PilJ